MIYFTLGLLVGFVIGFTAAWWYCVASPGAKNFNELSKRYEEMRKEIERELWGKEL